MSILKKIENDILRSRYKVINKVKPILDNILIQVSVEEKATIICNVINEMSLDLIYNGASPKPHYISGHTQKSGLLGGFILDDNGEDNKVSKRAVSIKCIEKYFFYSSNSSIIPTKTLKNGISYIKGIVDQDNRFLTSDLDILAIAPSSSVDYTTLPTSYSMGNILKI